MRAIGASGTPVKYLAREVKDLNLDLEEHNLLSLSYGRIIRKDIESNEGLLPANFERYTVVRPGDVVLRLTDLQNDQRSLRTGLVREPGIITSAYLTLRPQSTVDSRYFAYALHAVDVAKVFYTLGGGLRQSMGMEDVGGLRLALPPLEEQRRVADFLDDQVDRIESVMAGKRIQAAALLSAARSSVEDAIFPSSLLRRPITPRSVVEFADPFTNSPPDRWVKVPLRRILTKVSVASGGEGQLLSVFLDRGVIPFAEAGSDRVHNPSLDLSAYQQVARGDLVMNNQQAWRGSVGVSMHDGIVSPAYHVYRVSREMSSDWANLAFRTYTMTFLYEQVSRGVGSIQRNLDSSSLMSLPFLMPDRRIQHEAEQKALDQSTNFSNAAELVDRSSTALGKLRTSLIMAAVTGELDVTTARRGLPA